MHPILPDQYLAGGHHSSIDQVILAALKVNASNELEVSSALSISGANTGATFALKKVVAISTTHTDFDTAHGFVLVESEN